MLMSEMLRKAEGFHIIYKQIQNGSEEQLRRKSTRIYKSECISVQKHDIYISSICISDILLYKLEYITMKMLW